jgi:hypothetical protein
MSMLASNSVLLQTNSEMYTKIEMKVKRHKKDKKATI